VPEPRIQKKTGRAFCSFCRRLAVVTTMKGCDDCRPFAEASQSLADQAQADITRTETAAHALIDSVPEGRAPTDEQRQGLLLIITPLAGLRQELNRQTARADRHRSYHTHQVYACADHTADAGLPDWVDPAGDMTR
jgi:uncharacterized Zn finger protein (UPF0148 family)